MTQWAYTPSFNYTVSTTPSPSTVHRQTDFHSGPILPQDTVGLYPLIYLQSEYHSRHLLYIDFPASVPPLLVQWAHPYSFMTEWAYTLSVTYRVSTNLVIYCTQTVQPQFLPYLHSGPIPPHFMTQ